LIRYKKKARNMSENLHLSQLLSSRICHDLVGVAGAINAGIELIGEDPTDIKAPLDLMAASAVQVTRRLSFFRIAFGSAGGVDSPITDGEIQKLSEEYLADKKIQLNWSALDFTNNGTLLNSLCGKILLNLFLVSSDCLPRGGEVRAHVAPLDNGIGIAIEAMGVGANFPENIKSALKTTEVANTLTVRNVHAYVACQLVNEGNGKVEFSETDDSVKFGCIVTD
jgi:histidine phosphotransferase ChpT